jgi:hypothetical protein
MLEPAVVDIVASPRTSGRNGGTREAEPRLTHAGFPRPPKTTPKTMVMPVPSVDDGKAQAWGIR